MYIYYTQGRVSFFPQSSPTAGAMLSELMVVMVRGWVGLLGESESSLDKEFTLYVMYIESNLYFLWLGVGDLACCSCWEMVNKLQFRRFPITFSPPITVRVV